MEAAPKGSDFIEKKNSPLKRLRNTAIIRPLPTLLQ